MMRFIFRGLLVFAPLPAALFALNLACRLVAVANALWGMVIIVLLLVLLFVFGPRSCWRPLLMLSLVLLRFFFSFSLEEEADQ
jgi:steroid 5-alpha reductase family enzyme